MTTENLYSLSLDLVEQALTDLELYYFKYVGREALGLFYDELILNISLNGENNDLLVVEITPFDKVPMTEYDNLRQYVNKWNATTIWPRAYTSISDEGVLRAMCDDAIDLESGVALSQLTEQIKRILATASMFYEQLSAAYNQGWEE